MKGDFSKWGLDPTDNFSGVLHQQGRVLLDQDWNAAEQINRLWRGTTAADVIGSGVAAVPVAQADSLKVTQADASAAGVEITLLPGRVWVDGVHLHYGGVTPITAEYLSPPPLQSPQASVDSIANGVRDAVILETRDEAFSAFQDPLHLLEAALGGPDTTERVRTTMALKLLRLGAGDDCANLAIADDFDAKGRLTVTPSPSVIVAGPCPVPESGGYSGFEHYLYRVEIATPEAGAARFKWSQYNGGLVGRGAFSPTGATSGDVAVTANNQMINQCGLDRFYLEALEFDTALGHWRVVLSADATLPSDDNLSLTNIIGTWPAGTTGFFRLWNGIDLVSNFPTGLALANELETGIGIRLAFDAPLADLGNYTPGDFWTIPARAAGVDFDPSVWPTNAVPQGAHCHRAPLAIITWSRPEPVTATAAAGEIDDCRRVFRPLTNQKVCCTFTVGDGESSHGDFDSIEVALLHLPASGGEICLLPGLHHSNVEISNRVNVKIKGCDTKTKIVPRLQNQTAPIFHIVDSVGVTLEHMDMTTLGGVAILIEGTRPGSVGDVTVQHNRIIACIHAVRAVNLERFSFHHNRIHMLDREDGDVAIFVSGDDGLIERNELTVIPAPEMPPIDDPDGGEPVDPVDPCARFEIAYRNRPLFIGYVNLIWGMVFGALPAAPYRALGGIQLAGGCERVRLLENTIRGGGGNGVTLGNTLPDAQQPQDETSATEHRVSAVNSMIAGAVVPPSGTSPSAIQLSFTAAAGGTSLGAVSGEDGGFAVRPPDGAYLVSVVTPGFAIDKIDIINLGATRLHVLTLAAVEIQPEPEAFGFLYDIAIERNHIQSMGLSGIGVAPAGSVKIGAPPVTTNGAAPRAILQTYLALLGQPVIGLFIAGNRIEHCLRNPFDAELRQQATRRGVGGVSLGYCEDLVLRENHIEANGLSHATPVCGIYITFGEDVEITLNRIVNNGPLATQAGDLIAGRRGGIVLNLVASLSVLDALSGTGGARASGRPAAVIHENVVDQPAGLALYALAMGPIDCTDNAFVSELAGLSVFERMAGTVFLYNLGGIQSRPPASSYTKSATIATNFSAESDTAPAGASVNDNVDAATNSPAQPAAYSYRSDTAVSNLSRPAASQLALPGGATQFCHNQSRTGAANTSTTSHVIAAMDDLDYSHNQSTNMRSAGVFANALLAGTTLRASGSRFREVGAETLLSLVTVASRLNATTFNQADHCIIVIGTDSAYPEVQDGNMVIDNSRCRSFNMIAELALKQRG